MQLADRTTQGHQQPGCASLMKQSNVDIVVWIEMSDVYPVLDSRRFLKEQNGT